MYRQDNEIICVGVADTVWVGQTLCGWGRPLSVECSSLL